MKEFDDEFEYGVFEGEALIESYASREEARTYIAANMMKYSSKKGGESSTGSDVMQKENISPERNTLEETKTTSQYLPKQNEKYTVNTNSGEKIFVYNENTKNWEYYVVVNGKRTLSESYSHESIIQAEEEFSSDNLFAEIEKFLKAVADKNFDEAIFSMGEILFQVGLATKECAEMSPIAADIIIFGINMAIAPIALATWAYVDPIEKAGWYDLMLMFIFELQGDVIISNSDSPALSELAKHKGVLDAKDLAKEMGKTLNVGGSSKGSSVFHYRKPNMMKNLDEMKTMDPSQVNSLELFMGSYTVNFEVTKKSSTQLTFKWTVLNTSGLESATRFRRSDGNQNQSILNNKPRGEGIHIGGTFTQTFKSTEIIGIPK